LATFPAYNRINLVDAKGYYGHFSFFTQSGSDNDNATLWIAVKTALAALTNAAVNGGTGRVGYLQLPGVLGTQADFGSIEDKATLTYVDAAGSIHRYQVPAPKASIFYADEMTINPLNSLVIAFNTVFLNAGANTYFVASRGGSAITEFIGGVRVRRRNQRRVSIFTRNPAETGPAE
jgi:hypothetical protein